MNITELMAFGKIETFNMKDIIVKEGESADTAYIMEYKKYQTVE